MSSQSVSPDPGSASLRARLELKAAELRSSDMGKAAGLAGAMIANNVVALGSTVVFARLLDDYGSLSALVSYFLILSVAGQALQVATAREGVLGLLGVGDGLLHTIRAWTRTLLFVTAGLTVLSIIFQGPIADAVGVKKYPWGAAVGIPAGCLWLELSILRGALQGVGDYRSVGVSLVGEQTVRLISGAILAAAGLGVSGAFLGTPISFIVLCGYAWVKLKRYADAHEGREPETQAAFSLWNHVRDAWAPIGGLAVIALLQNIDLIVAKHQFTKNVASSYAAVAVAAKVLIWVATGAGFYLVPEVSRRRSQGQDTRPVLFRALAIVVVCAVPVLLILGLGGHFLIQTVYGAKRLPAVHALLPLGIAFTVLAGTYLAIQYLLALKRIAFLVVLGLVAVAEPVLLLTASKKPASFAATVLAVQAAGAVLAFGLALRRGAAPAG